nr:ATP-binding cassette domain-containing protein [Longibacter salinarum]
MDFEVRPGETVALVGPSGSGKTTLMNLIPRFFDPTSGRVLVGGYDIRDVRKNSLRKQISVVSQEARLHATSIGENIRYGRLNASDEEVRNAARAANAHGFISEFEEGYDTPAGEAGVRLSGGQRQRIAVARALLKNAHILLLDEATASLDSQSEAWIQDSFDQLSNSCTTFIISHRLATIRDVDRILVIQAGRLVQEGTHAELVVKDGLYRTMASHQFREVKVTG